MMEANEHAQWIWCRGDTRPKNFYLYVRKSFLIPGALQHATIRVTADSRYRLFVNGIPVARGPARCDRRWQCMDQWDITPQLRPGTNVIAALVHHYGEWTFSYMLGRGGLFAEIEVVLADGTVMHVGTDGSWRVQPARAWERSLPRMSIQLGYPEVFDARQEIEDWNDPAFDDARWETATVLGPAGMEPWPQFVPRGIPAMQEILLRPEQVIDSGEVGRANTGHYVDLLRVIWNTSHGVGYLATFVWSPEESEYEIHAGSQEAMRLWVNREIVISHLVTRDPAPDQEIVPVWLHAGWNTLLAKIVQGEGQWHFYFRLEGNGSEHLIYSALPEERAGERDLARPWWFIGPFDSRNLKQGFEAAYAPEQELDFQRSYTGKGGQEITWMSAGVTDESMLTAVIMSREERFPHRGGTIEHPDGLIHPGAPAIIHPGTGQDRYAVVDFGKEVTGHPVIEIDWATGGEIIDLGYSEILQTSEGEILSPASGIRGKVNPDRANVHYADRYICRPGRQRFQTFDKRAFRYLQVDVRNAKQDLAVGPVSLIFSTYPVEYKGDFNCPDPLLNRIWEVGRWSVHLNMEDAYTDCPWRERGQWWGDARVQVLVNYYTFGDFALVRNGLRQIAQSQTGEGVTMGIYPTDWSYGILPTFTLLWIVSLWDYYVFSGDEALLEELFPAVERAVEFFERFRSSHDLLRNVPYWLFVDWADVETQGESASVNALYHGALLAAADIADVLPHHRTGTDYRLLAHRIQNGMRQTLWDEQKGCFRDAWKDGVLNDKITEQANCWAIAFGAAPEGTDESILEALFDKHAATVSTGTPYFAFYVLRAMAKGGKHERSLEYIRANWGTMLEWGATSWWEQWDPKASSCHGWSSGPTHFLQSEILGVKPFKPGWEEILIAPHPAGLSSASGKVPTPRGIISVEWKQEDDFTILVTAPTAVRVMLPVSKKGPVSVTTGEGDVAKDVLARIQQLHGKGGQVTLLLREPGAHRIVVKTSHASPEITGRKENA
jgi:alpha-L-rhamnosidase